MISRQRIIFRADGNSQIGLGHVVRSLALAAMLRDNFECIFAIQSPTEELQTEIKAVCDGIISLPACSVTEERYLHELDAYISKEEIVVLDGYRFNTAYQRSIKAKGATVVCIDDIHAYHFVADVVISHVVGLKRDQFSVEQYTKLYLGAEYALLRKDFFEVAHQKTNPKANPHTVFICLGGADPTNKTLEVLKQCAAIAPNLKYKVVIGAAYKYKESLSAFAASVALDIILLESLNVNEMLFQMQSAAAAITSASTVAYEYLCTHGILYLLQTADNQAEVYRYLVENKIALPLERFGETLPESEKLELLKKSSHIFDGKQPQRLRNIFNDIAL